MNDSFMSVIYRCLYGLVSLCKTLELSPFVLCPDLVYVLFVSLINVGNGSRHVFVVHIICDFWSAHFVSCYIITLSCGHMYKCAYLYIV
jgi:hypothetical protein